MFSEIDIAVLAAASRIHRCNNKQSKVAMLYVLLRFIKLCLGQALFSLDNVFYILFFVFGVICGRSTRTVVPFWDLLCISTDPFTRLTI